MIILNNYAQDEIDKFEIIIKENKNIFNLPEWEAFRKDSICEIFIYSLINELSTYKFLINGNIQKLSLLMKEKETIFNNMNLTGKLDANKMIISVLQFFNEKLKSNMENRNFLNIVEFFLLLEEKKGSILIKKSDEFDFEKYHQDQSIMNIHDYNRRISEKLNKFQLMMLD